MERRHTVVNGCWLRLDQSDSEQPLSTRPDMCAGPWPPGKASADPSCWPPPPPISVHTSLWKGACAAVGPAQPACAATSCPEHFSPISTTFCSLLTVFLPPGLEAPEGRAGSALFRATDPVRTGGVHNRQL